jgi:isopenicillin-N N-acyltransferase like protein
MARPIPLIEAGGPPRTLGCQVGRARAESVHRMIASYRALFEEHSDQLGIRSWKEAILHARKYLPFAEESVPECVEELIGLAEGAEARFDDVLVLNCTEALTSDALHLKCTSLMVGPQASGDGSVLAGHNEDWLPADLEEVYLLRARPERGPAFLAMSYGALLPNIGLNQAGIAQCCDSVYPTDVRIGVPRILVSRSVLGAATLGEAIERALNKRRAAGYNHLLVHQSGEAYNLEVSGHAHELLYAEDGVLAHANHYLGEKMRTLERGGDPRVSSHIRHHRAWKLLKEQSGQHSVASLQAILRDHVNYPQSICNHVVPDDSALDHQQTIVSLILDLTRREVHAAWGTPCMAEYAIFKMEA